MWNNFTPATIKDVAHAAKETQLSRQLRRCCPGVGWLSRHSGATAKRRTECCTDTHGPQPKYGPSPSVGAEKLLFARQPPILVTGSAPKGPTRGQERKRGVVYSVVPPLTYYIDILVDVYSIVPLLVCNYFWPTLKFANGGD